MDMSMENFWFNALYSVAPTIGIGLIFWFVVRAIIHADRNERKARAKVEAQLRAEREKGTADG
jgi:hypothetical protein